MMSGPRLFFLYCIFFILNLEVGGTMELVKGNYYFVLHFVLPLSLLISWSIRINGLSAIYGILFLVNPFISGMYDNKVSIGAIRYLQLCLATGFLCGTAQIIFHVCLLSRPPYGRDFVDCDYYEKISRQIGFQRLDMATAVQLIRLISPEIIVCCVSLFANRFRMNYSNLIKNRKRKKANKNKNKSKKVSIEYDQENGVVDFSDDENKDKNFIQKIFHSKYLPNHRILKKALTCVFCGIAAIIYPSLFSLTYFIIFLSIATTWSMNRDFPDKIWTRLRMVIFFVCLVQIVCLYAYQFESFYEFLPPTSFEVRILGLLPIVRTDCSNVRSLEFYRDNIIIKFLNLVFLFFLYTSTIIVIRIDNETSRINSAPKIRRDPTAMLNNDYLNESLLNSYQYVFCKSFGGEVLALDKNFLNENNPKEMDKDEMTKDKIHTEELRRKSLVPSLHSLQIANRANKTLEILAKQSYVILLMIMMAWSITYHSWLTFILLILACLVWMLPDPRKFCFTVSPYFVVYAEILVILQFIYSLPLTEEELPSENPKALRQIGLERPKDMPAVIPLMIKIFYTCGFWLALRQHMKEKAANKNKMQNALKEAFCNAFENVRLTTMDHSIETITRGRSHSAMILASNIPWISKFADFVKLFITKYWIFVCCIVLLMISLNSPVVGYRIIYMGFLLMFINCFLLSFRSWRKLLYYFWSIMIIYCMGVLTFIYTYQFHGFPEIWQNGTGWSLDVLESLGLERYSSGELLLKLLTPISFLLCAIIQLKFFHKDLIRRTKKLEELIRKPSDSIKNNLKGSTSVIISSSTDDEQLTPTPDESKPVNKNPEEIQDRLPENKNGPVEITTVVGYFQNFISFVKDFLEKHHELMIDCFWKLLEMHLPKLIGFIMISICVMEVSIVNSPYIFYIVIGFTHENSIRFLSKIASLWTSCIILIKLLFQMKFIKESDMLVNCAAKRIVNNTFVGPLFPFPDNKTVNSASWVGFHKSTDVSLYLTGYLLLMGLFALQELIHMRQLFRKHKKNIIQEQPLRNVLFPHVTRLNADSGVPNCIMFFINYGFYKFGLEICFLSTVATIGLRCDFVSFLYAICLTALMTMKRDKITRLWSKYVTFLGALLPIQYLLCLGMPPVFCVGYPWSKFNKNALEWLYLPDFVVVPNPLKLGGDFFQFLFACSQWYVFAIEAEDKDHTYPGGDNSEMTFTTTESEDKCEEEKKTLNISDFISHQKSYLDLIKNVVFIYFYWISLAVVFMAGVSRVTIFAMGYVVACFLFLWQGNELFLKPMHIGLRLWNMLISYNVVVVFLKTTLQVIGCVYLDDLYKKYCWALQLFGIACLKTGVNPAETLDAAILGECNVPTEEAGILFDGICFFFLILQRRIFTSHYFEHVVAEFRAQQVYASRGAELINNITKKELQEQQAKEKEIVDKLMSKMNKIKEAQKGIGEDNVKIRTHKQAKYLLRWNKSRYLRMSFRSQSKSILHSAGQDIEQALAMKFSLESASPPKDRTMPENIPHGKKSVRFRDLSFDESENTFFNQPDLRLFPSPNETEHPAQSPIPFITSPDTPKPFPHVVNPARNLQKKKDDDEDDSFHLLDQTSEEIVPDAEFDRRKGLGPLQLLNIAFKKGTFKKAVEDALKVKKKHDKLIRKFSERQQVADEKVIRKMLKKQIPGKVLADFEENAFDDEFAENNSEKPETNELKTHISPEDITEGQEAAVENEITLDSDDEDEEDEIVVDNSMDEENLKQYSFIKRQLLKRQEFLTYFIAFLKLFFIGVIESTIIWLLKLSRKYRYVAHVLGHEKASYKQGISLTDQSADISSSMELKLHDDVTDSLSKAEELKFNQDRNMFVRLFVASFYLLLSHSELFCYLLMVLNHMSSGSFITAPLPIMAFIWGTLSVPKPTKRFWISIITYTEAVVIVKYVFQFGFFPWNKYAPPPDPLWPPRILGIEKQDKYAAWDLALLMVLFLHRSVLKVLGLWDEIGEGSIKIDQKLTTDQNVSTETLSIEISDDEHLEADFGLPGNDNGDFKISPKVIVNKAKFYCDKFFTACINFHLIEKGITDYVLAVIKFFRTLLQPESRISIDVYVPMFLCDFICFGTVIFGYSAFGTDSSGGVAGALEDNKVPGPFLAMLVVQFVLIITDRALFLRKFLFGKLVYQIFLVFFVHVWMFLILPAVTEREFVSNKPANVWFFTKCIYLCLSAWQIRAGYPTRVLGNVLTKKYNYISLMLFKGFMNIPFLFELRSLMDWIWTDTSMSLSDWIKLEDIYANIYMLKCERKVEEDYPTPRGEKRRPFIKYGYGGMLLFFMILIIWFPLVLFSLANTVGLRNLPVDCTVKLTIGAYPTLYIFSAQQNSIRQLTYDEFDALKLKYKYNKMAISYMSDYSYSDVIEVIMESDSNVVWSISYPSKTGLIADLNSTKSMSLKFEWQFTRPPESSTGQTVVVTEENNIALDVGGELRTNILEMITGRRKQIMLPKLYPSYVKLPGKGKASHVTALLIEKVKQNPKDGYTNVTMSIQQKDHQEWWSLSIAHRPESDSETPPKGQISMIAFVDKVFPSTFNMIAGGGIIGVYASLVLVVGKYIRGLVTGSMQKIMFEDLPNVDRILQLCLDIFLVREAGELTLEEDLFAKLIFLYRSPATLIKWTKSKE